MIVTLFPDKDSKIGKGCDDYGRSFLYVTDSDSGIKVEMYLGFKQCQKLKRALMYGREKRFSDVLDNWTNERRVARFYERPDNENNKKDRDLMKKIAERDMGEYI